jgi:hypothetical protein
MASLDQIRARGERDLHRTLKGLGRKHQKAIRAAIRKYGSLDAIPGTFWLKLQRDIENESAVLLLLIFAAAHVSTQDALGFQRPPHDVALSGSQFASARAVEFARQHLQHTRERLQKAQEKLREALKGEPISPAELADKIDVGTILSDERAERAAVTETTTGISGGQKGGADDFEQDTGIQVKRYWVTERDERVCPICAPLHGTEQTTWPPDLSNGPPAHVNCRCHKRLTPIAQPAYRRGAA